MIWPNTTQNGAGVRNVPLRFSVTATGTYHSKSKTMFAPVCNTHNAFTSTVIAFVVMMVAVPFFAIGQDLREDPEAREVFEELDRRRDLITYEKSDMKMVIYDARGRTRTREMRSFSYDEEEVSKSLIVFESPADVRGTAFLSIREGSEEIQKLYLPALNRVQVISAAEKSDRFMGSDFTYEDLGDQNPDDYTFTLVSESDSVDLLRAEKKGKSQYRYIHFHVDPERYILLKAEYFNDEGTKIKRLEASDYQNVLKDVWRPGTMIMYDLRNDRRTELSWSDRTINESIPGWRFTERGLRRGL